MVVWLVWFHNFQGELEFSGVFSSEEKAQAYVNQFKTEKHLFKIEAQESE